MAVSTAGPLRSRSSLPNGQCVSRASPNSASSATSSTTTTPTTVPTTPRRISPAIRVAPRPGIRRVSASVSLVIRASSRRTVSLLSLTRSPYGRTGARSGLSPTVRIHRGPGRPSVIDVTMVDGETFQSVDPATGEQVGTLPGARRGGRAWPPSRGPGRPRVVGRARLRRPRAERLALAGRALASRTAELAELIHREGGKPVDDAMIELATAIEHLHWAPRNAQRVLGPRRVRPGLLRRQPRRDAGVPAATGWSA